MTSALDQIGKLQAQIDQKRVEAITELRARKAELRTEMRILDQQIAALSGDRSGAGRATRHRDPTKPCRVCGELGHDGRKHRFEAPKRKK